MKRKKMPKGIRKFIRQEKARIRREIFNLSEQKKLIEKLYQKFQKQNANSGNIQSGNK